MEADALIDWICHLDKNIIHECAAAPLLNTWSWVQQAWKDMGQNKRNNSFLSLSNPLAFSASASSPISFLFEMSTPKLHLRQSKAVGSRLDRTGIT